MPTIRKQKVAVLGGGIAGLTAAYELSKDPERYEVTVYQQGWLLGGKGASTRNEACDYRIEEHGLHIWMGWYDNAFEMLGQCYDDLARPDDHVLRTLDDAFLPLDLIGLAEPEREEWEFWLHHFAVHVGEPGAGTEDPTAWDYLIRMLESLVVWLADPDEIAGDHPRAKRVNALAAFLATFLQSLDVARRLAARADMERPSLVTRMLVDKVVAAVDRFVDEIEGHLEHEAQNDAWLRHYLIVADFARAVTRGLVREGVVFGSDWGLIDDYEAKEFLARYGAGPRTLDSALVRGCYNLSFCHHTGAGAGTSLLGIFRMMLSYRGHIFYRMAAGMGEVVFVPIYQLLRKRGVRFEFFHRVEALRLDGDRRSIASVEIAREVELKAPEYDPLERLDLKIDGFDRWLEYWPRRPRAEQLVTPIPPDVDPSSRWSDWKDVEMRMLLAGEDFDRVVLAIGVGALPSICADLVEASPAWRKMLDSVKTTPTASAQLWLTPALADLGWKHGPIVIGGAPEPFDTWADMSHLIPVERAPAGSVKNIAYFCSPLMEDEKVPPHGADAYPQRQHARVHAAARKWLDDHARSLWPNAVTAAGGLDTTLLRDPNPGGSRDALDRQYFRANVEPSDRYVLSVAGSTKHRLRPDDSGFGSLVLAGDWTRLPLSAGCIESAVDSGIAAANALRSEHAADDMWEKTSALRALGRGRASLVGSLVEAAGDEVREVAEAIRTGLGIDPDPSLVGELARVLAKRVTNGSFAGLAASLANDLSGLRRARPAARPAGGRRLTPLPDYIAPPGMIVPPGPYLMGDVTMYSFIVAVDEAPLQALLDSQFNHLNTGVRYSPLSIPLLGSRVIFSFADIASMTSTHSSQLGTMSEQDLIVWVPTVARGRTADGVRPAPFSWFCAYTWVDSGAAVATGREVFGFPKTDAVFRKEPAGNHRIDRLRADALAIRRRGGHAERMTVVDIERVGPKLLREPEMWTKVESMAAKIAKLILARAEPDSAAVDPPDGALATLLGMLTGTQWMLFLKQFRDAEDSRRACLIEIIEAPAKVLRLPVGGPLWGKYVLRIGQAASLDLASRLGLPADTDIPVRGAFWSQFDFSMTSAKRVWGIP